MGIFKAFGRLMKAFAYLLTGKMGKAREALMSNPDVMRAGYDEVIEEEAKNVKEVSSGVATLMGIVEERQEKADNLEAEIEKFERFEAAAIQSAKERAAELQASGKTQAEVQEDAEFQKHQTNYQNFSSTRAAKAEQFEDLLDEIQNYNDQIETHKRNLRTMVDNVNDLRAEREEAVVDVVTSKALEQATAQLNGIDTNKNAEKLRELRSTRSKHKGKARLASEMAGMHQTAIEAEYEEAANSAEANEEFNKAIFGGFDQAVDINEDRVDHIDASN